MPLDKLKVNQYKLIKYRVFYQQIKKLTQKQINAVEKLKNVYPPLDVIMTQIIVEMTENNVNNPRKTVKQVVMELHQNLQKIQRQLQSLEDYVSPALTEYQRRAPAEIFIDLINNWKSQQTQYLYLYVQLRQFSFKHLIESKLRKVVSENGQNQKSAEDKSKKEQNSAQSKNEQQNIHIAMNNVEEILETFSQAPSAFNKTQTDGKQFSEKFIDELFKTLNSQYEKEKPQNSNTSSNPSSYELTDDQKIKEIIDLFSGLYKIAINQNDNDSDNEEEDK